MRNLLSEQVPIEVRCDKHHTERVNGYSISRKAMTCPKCPKDQDPRKYVPVKYTDMESCCLKLVDFLRTRIDELKEALASLKGVLD